MMMKWQWSFVAAVVVACGLPACTPSDPSAREEAERLKAELAAKQREIEQMRQMSGGKDGEVEMLRSKIEELTAQLQQAAKMQVPSEEEIEQKLGYETVRLRRQAEEKLPGYTISEVTLGSVNIPSPEHPFSCEVAMTLQAPDGQVGQLFWKGLGDLQGNWTYEPIERLSTGTVTPPAGGGPAVAARNQGAAPVTPPPAAPPPPPREKTASEKLAEQAGRQGGMSADKTIIIDLTKLQPLNIPAGSGP